MPKAPPWLKRISSLAAWRRSQEARTGWRLNRPKATKPRTYKPIHLATLIGLTTVALAVTGVAAWLMWDAAQVPAKLTTSPDLAVRAAQLRVDVIRNILAVGAGTGGLIALFLALRRQYVKERVDYADQEHKNRTAEDARHDATERRVTDLYVKAAEQLGSDKAAVRMAALYALERLGQDNPEHRQTIVDLICAYLRMPFKPPGELGIRRSPSDRDEEDEKRYHELQVRKAAQDILTRRLRYSKIVGVGRRRNAEGPSTFWAGMHLNLSDALLTFVNFRHCAVASIGMSRARIEGRADFSHFFCGDFGVFTGVRFCQSADFSDSIFNGFIGTESSFMGEAIFTKAKLNLGQLNGVNFVKGASFGKAHAFVWDFEGSRAVFPARHTWPEGFSVKGELKDGYAFVVNETGRGWWEEEVEEIEPVNLTESLPGPRMPLTMKGDAVNPQPNPDLEG